MRHVLRGSALLLQLVLTGALVGCPQGAVDSVDGLKGGALTSALAVPSLTVEGALTAASAQMDDVTSTDVAAATADIEELTAGRATVESLSVSGTVAELEVSALTATSLSAGEVTASSLDGTSVVTDALVKRRGARARSLYGDVVGVTAYGNAGCAQNGSFQEADCSCAAAFPAPSAAHVCTEEELLIFAETQPQLLPAGLDGASFNAFSGRVGPRVTMPPPDSQERFTWVDNCGSWSSFEASAEPNFSVRDASMAAARHVVRVVDNAGGGLRAINSDISTDCRRTAVQLACCR